MNPLAGPAGPGKYSTRTDKLEMGSIAYGEGVETAAIKSGAPLAKTPDVTPSQAPSVPMGPTVSLYDQTQRPEEPITSGIDMGPGPGSDSLMMRSQFAQEKLSNTLAKMLPYDQTGEISILYQQALARGM
jgi:hypothetical protein